MSLCDCDWRSEKHYWPCRFFVPAFKVGDRVRPKSCFAFYGGIEGTVVKSGGGDSYYIMQPESVMHKKKCTALNLFHGFELEAIEPCDGCLQQREDTEDAWLAHFRQAHNG